MCVVGDDFGEMDNTSMDEGGAGSSAERQEGGWRREGEKGRKRPRSTAVEAAVRTKQGMEKLIHAHGGSVRGNPREDTTSFVVVGAKNTVSVQGYINSGLYNVVDYGWLLDCIARGKYEFPTIEHLRQMSPAVQEHMSGVMDPYGDYYLEPTDTRKLRQVMSRMKPAATPSVSPVNSTKAESYPYQCSFIGHGLDESEQEVCETPFRIFWNRERCLIYIDQYQELGSPEAPRGSSSTGVRRDGVSRGNVEGGTRGKARALVPYSCLGSTAATVRLYGGEVATSLHVGVTHVIIDPEDKARLPSIQARIWDLHGRPDSLFHKRLVTPEWVFHCVAVGRLVPPEDSHIIKPTADNSTMPWS
ncbi:unnamed protein product [Discosporangium mesarthrocarpum]